MKKITAFMICLIALSAMLISYSFADSESSIDFANADSYDTLSYSQAEYNQFVARTALSRATDEAQLEVLAKAFLSSMKASVREPELYACDTFVLQSERVSNNIEYRLSEAEYQAKLNEALGWEITSDNISFSNYACSIDGSTAEVSIVEDYTYEITDGFDDESFRRREYYLSLQNNGCGWEIISVKTNDPWETDEAFQYAAIDVDEEISNLIAEKNAEIIDTSNHIEPASVMPLSTLKKWTYTAKTAANYAANHYKDTTNEVFGFTTGNDCQNFASQCVWAGLGGSGSDPSAIPAVSIALAGGEYAKNIWQRGYATKYYSDDLYWLNWTWDNVRGFTNMICMCTGSWDGPYGYVEHTGGFKYSEVGNVLEVDWEGSPSRDTLDHAMFVTQVSGTSGSRTAANVKIAAHTSATNSAYQTVASYTSIDTSAFARVVVQGGYYQSAQP